MSDFSKEKTETAEILTPDEESTVFGAPADHNKKKQRISSKKKSVIKLTAAVLSVAVLVGGLFAVIKFVPKKTDESDNNSSVNTVSVLSLDITTVSEVKVTNQNGTFRLYSSTVEVDGQENSVWCLDGVDSSLTSSTLISNIASNATSITAVRDIEKTDRPLSDFGLDSPVSSAQVAFKDGSEGYSVMLGKQSPDNTGTYLKLSNRDNIYIVDDSVAESFLFNSLDLADNSSFEAAAFSGDISSYKGSSGSIEKFDEMTVSGKNFPRTVTILPNTNENLSSVAKFVIATPYERHAANVDNLLSMFTSGISVSGAYSFDVTPESLKKFGLDNPDVVVKMTLAGQTKFYKISKVDDEYCAVINEESKIIKKVYISSVPVSEYTEESFYNDWVCMEVISDLSNFTLTTSGTSYSFDIKYDKEADPQYTITHNGKKMTASYFQDFYGEFVSVKCTDFTIRSVSGEPAATVTLTYSADGSKKTYAFYKVSETKYQYSYNGVNMGSISSVDYNKMIKNIKTVSQNKSIK